MTAAFINVNIFSILITLSVVLIYNSPSIFLLKYLSSSAQSNVINFCFTKSTLSLQFSASHFLFLLSPSVFAFFPTPIMRFKVLCNPVNQIHRFD